MNDTAVAPPRLSVEEARALTERINQAGDELARAYIAHRNDAGAYPDILEFCRRHADGGAPEEVVETMAAIVAGRLPCLRR